jgi:hypothetical protein
MIIYAEFVIIYVKQNYLLITFLIHLLSTFRLIPPLVISTTQRSIDTNPVP